MTRQTRPPDEWIVADGGRHSVRCTQGQTHLQRPAPPGVGNFLDNLQAALRAATGDLIACGEDDDWYAPTHLATLLDQLTLAGVQIAGDPEQRYYHLPSQQWRVMRNKGASLCQTGFARALVPTLLDVITDRRARLTHPNPTERRRAIGVDFYFWHAVPRAAWWLVPTQTVVGIKGLAGTAGLGIGHRPGSGWTQDPDGRQLRAWVGADDAALYTSLDTTAPPG